MRAGSPDRAPQEAVVPGNGRQECAALGTLNCRGGRALGSSPLLTLQFVILVRSPESGLPASRQRAVPAGQAGRRVGRVQRPRGFPPGRRMVSPGRVPAGG